MYKAPNKIPEEEYNQRTQNLMIKLIPKGQADPAETNELFLLYNDRFAPHEAGKHCSGCRSRVYKRMLNYHQTLGE